MLARVPIASLGVDTEKQSKEEIEKALLSTWSVLLGRFSVKFSAVEAQALLDLFGDSLDEDIAEVLGEIVKPESEAEDSDNEDAGWGFDDEEDAPRASAKEQKEKPSLPSISIGAGGSDRTEIRSASDFLVWLVSHPIGQAHTPKDFASSQTLLRALRALGRQEGLIAPLDAWAAVRHAVAGASTAEPKGGDARWPRGEWGTKADTPQTLGLKDFELEEEAPAQFRREMSKDAYRAALDTLRKRLADHKLVGVHATTIENLGPLMTEGVSVTRIGTGHGKGKGEGFYIIPSAAGVYDVTKEEASGKAWGAFIAAVYLPRTCMSWSAAPGENVQTLEKQNKGGGYFYKFGDAEAVIPPAQFDHIILVRDPRDITMADPRLRAYSTKDSAVDVTREL
jgi:hypothetical protein